MSDAKTTAMRTLREIADQRFVDVTEGLMASNAYVWSWDPEVDDVLGLVQVDNPGKAVVVVYLNGLMPDFEFDLDLYSLMFSTSDKKD